VNAGARLPTFGKGFLVSVVIVISLVFQPMDYTHKAQIN
jgi:hypothetical protein